MHLFFYHYGIIVFYFIQQIFFQSVNITIYFDAQIVSDGAHGVPSRQVLCLFGMYATLCWDHLSLYLPQLWNRILLSFIGKSHLETKIGHQVCLFPLRHFASWSFQWTVRKYMHRALFFLSQPSAKQVYLFNFYIIVSSVQLFIL